MTASQLERAVKKYDAVLTALETALKKPDSHPSSEQILEVLVARHTVQVAIDQTLESDSKILVKTVKQLDNRLRKQVNYINKLGKLEKWRSHFNPPQEAWWWFLDSLNVQWWDRYDWLWSSLSMACMTASLSLIIDISSRFLSGGPDPVGTFAVITQSLLTLLAGGSTFTKSGQEGIKQVLETLRIPKHFWHEVGFSSSFMVLIGLLGFHQSLLPLIATKYNYFGEQDYAAGKLSSAEYKYNRALKLNPDYPEAHYNLGKFYEALQDTDRARDEYQLAVKAGYYQAATNLSRLYILKGVADKDNYSRAISWLTVSLPLAENDIETKYVILTNLGWARFEQGDYKKAENHLKEAIILVGNRASAYCLLAQVMDEQKETQSANNIWEQCIQYANQKNPDEDAWLGLARQRLQVKGGQP